MDRTEHTSVPVGNYDILAFTIGEATNVTREDVV